MQLSDADLLEDSHLKMTVGQDSSMERNMRDVASVSMNEQMSSKS